jgi:HAD superfamily hydrolase (TIGR01509 family)
MKDTLSHGCILFDWGDTLMRDFKEFSGPMKDWPRLEVIPGAVDTLTILHRDWTLGLATSADISDEADIRAALKCAGLNDLLDRIYCFKNTGFKKPSPAFYRHILDDLELEPRSVCMVGDHYEADVLAANACGIRAVWFNEHTDEERRGDMHRTIHDLSSLPGILRSHPKNNEEPFF